MAHGSRITRKDLEGKMVAWEMGGASRVKPKRHPNKRQCRETKTSTQKSLPLPATLRRSKPLGSSPAIARVRKELRGTKRENEKQKGKGISAGGGSARQRGRNLLFRKVSELLLSQRGRSSRSKTEQRTRVSVLVSSHPCPCLHRKPGGWWRLRR